MKDESDFKIGKGSEGSVLYNDALNTFIYGYMASDFMRTYGYFTLFLRNLLSY